ncbi:RNase MRP subunit [Purpureocillium takamizusanense]|uniref:RNase MRP subunit n=1 Tax=Purpureocillium takamizusanense TaxID=2060973 RepID=A0A9Q8V819_9HYPO|nr:RNase MRP subunit [Purpureocillium takamizusanense]UNI16278.1 RNase MRP subunit [Purpureocillium takamizusanense]
MTIAATASTPRPQPRAPSATAKAPLPAAGSALVPSPPADTRTAAAGSSLAETLYILDAFNHRHHNQHRATHWWPSFRILHRRLRALYDALLFSTRIPVGRPALSNPLSSSSAAARGRLVRLRAGWMRAHIVPRAYVSFSQLAADNQHAPLGLLLLAVLSRVDTVLATLVPSDDSAALLAPEVNLPRASVTVAHSMPMETEAPPPDLGVPVSRQVIPHPVEKHDKHAYERSPSESNKKRPRDTTADVAATGASGERRESKKKSRKKGKDGSDAFASLFGSLA